MMTNRSEKQVNSEEHFSDQISEKESRRQLRIKINQEAAVPIIQDLRNAGFEVEWISDLYTHKMFYKDGIPILLHWLPYIDNLDVKEEIVRALSVPWAKPMAAPALIQEFKKLKFNDAPGLQWAIGNALAVVADDEVLSDIVDLIFNKEYGKSREMLVVALGNMKAAYVQDILIDLLEDEDLVGYAVMALGKLKSHKAFSAIEKLSNHPKAWVRKEVKKALVKIEKAQTRNS